MGRRGSFICPPFSREKGAHGCSLRGPRRPLLAGGPPSRSIDGLTPATARKTGRLQRGERPGKGKNSPPSPGAKKLPLQGGGESPSLRQGAFVCCPTGHFWGRRPTAVRRRGRWILIGRRKGFIRLPFSREKGGARLFFAGAAPPPPRRRAPSRSIDGLAPVNARETGRLRSGGRPGKRKSLPSLPRGKEIALAGRGGAPVLSVREPSFAVL